mgnify:CR=1 FL=1
MIKKIKTIGIIGDGGWGTTLAVHLARKKARVILWGAFADYVLEMERTRVNKKFLPGIKLPKNITLTSQLSSAIGPADLVILATPSQYLRSVLKKIGTFDFSQKIILSVMKGIDTKSLERMSQIIHSELGNVHLAVLSGPTIAVEVAKGIPSTAVIACHNRNIAQTLQKLINSEQFRIYTNADVIGVELGGSIKNIIAIACGVCDGLGLGSNTKAAILTRGLAEMARLGAALGAQTKTFFGLTGLGDLVTTCVSSNSRNRFVGEELAKGKSIQQITGAMSMVAEGVETAKAVYHLGQKMKIPMPISTEVYNIIYKKKKPRQAVNDLMRRETGEE